MVIINVNNAVNCMSYFLDKERERAYRVNCKI